MPSSSPQALPLTDLVAGLGAGLAEVIGSGADPAVDDITLAELSAGSVGAPGDLVLGVGILDPDSAVALVDAAAAAGIDAIALRRSATTHPEVAAAAGAAGIRLVAIADEASWAHVAWRLREVIDRAPTLPATNWEAGPDELFTLADACAALLDAPVTIEDTRSRVLAYSQRHDLSDPIRISTIIGRRVPAEIVSSLRARGVFRHLVRSAEPLFLPAASDGSLGARLIVPVRAGEEWVGSIWAMVDRPVGDELLRPLREVAAIVALHLLRLRSGSDLGRRLLRDQLRGALGGDAAVAGSVLPEPPWRVVVLGSDASTGDVEDRLAVWESVLRRAFWQRPNLVAVDEDLVVIATDRPEASGPGTWRWLRRLVTQVAMAQPWAWAATGPPAGSASELAVALGGAREVSRLLAAGTVPGPVATAEEAWAQLVVARAVAAVGPMAGSPGDGDAAGALARAGARAGARGGARVGEAPVGPIGDGDYLDPALVATLRAWLDHPGDARAAAADLHVHPNTVRYRLGRLRSELGVDLTDPTVRLALALQVRGARPASQVHP